MEVPRPLEEVDPWLAEQFRQIANHEHETIQSLYVIGGKMYIRPKQTINISKVGRNDPCPCMSGRKYKHCCGRR